VCGKTCPSKGKRLFFQDKGLRVMQTDEPSRTAPANASFVANP